MLTISVNPHGGGGDVGCDVEVRDPEILQPEQSTENSGGFVFVSEPSDRIRMRVNRTEHAGTSENGSNYGSLKSNCCGV